ncbi:hypothetical protein [Leptospira vanthielii]|uniref:hypothetical protein n=1 Tax=Leptospira vanthielii TaxID=293085 RepID=UPI000586760F|nr:hypothetical protein [Leptospira vanthielii]
MIELIELLSMDCSFDIKYFLEIVKECLIIGGILFAGFIAYQIAFRELKFSAIRELIERDKNLRREFLNEISHCFSIYHDIFVS